jgi:hypothetical protein
MSAFDELYGRTGRPSIPARDAAACDASAGVLQHPLERLDFDPLSRWFAGLSIDDPVWDHSVVSKNRDRLLAGDLASRFLPSVLSHG